MAANSGDFAGGFRHNEVVSFINNEVLRNGGGPDFYTTFRSQSWDEIEDRLRTVLTDPQTPRHRKRACTWSALTLGVRVAARQQEQQVPRVRELKKRVEESKAASGALASQLRQVLKERDQAASNLQCVLAALRQTNAERDKLCQRLLQVDISAQANPLPQAILPVKRDQQRGAPGWPMNAEKQGKMVATAARRMPNMKTQMAALEVKLYVSRTPRAMQPELPTPAAYPLPVRAPFSKGFPYLTALPSPQRVMIAEGAVAKRVAAAEVSQIPPLGIYPPHLCAAVGVQKQMSSLSDQRGDPWLPQKYLLGNSKSQSQEKGPVMAQGMLPLWESQSGVVRKWPGKQQPQGQKANQPKGMRISESQHQGMSASCCSPQNWECPWCQVINFAFFRVCCKCKKISMAVP